MLPQHQPQGEDQTTARITGPDTAEPYLRMRLSRLGYDPASFDLTGAVRAFAMALNWRMAAAPMPQDMDEDFPFDAIRSGRGDSFFAAWQASGTAPAFPPAQRLSWLGGSGIDWASCFATRPLPIFAALRAHVDCTVLAEAVSRFTDGGPVTEQLRAQVLTAEIGVYLIQAPDVLYLPDTNRFLTWRMTPREFGGATVSVSRRTVLTEAEARSALVFN